MDGANNKYDPGASDNKHHGSGSTGDTYIHKPANDCNKNHRPANGGGKANRSRRGEGNNSICENDNDSNNVTRGRGNEKRARKCYQCGSTKQIGATCPIRHQLALREGIARAHALGVRLPAKYFAEGHRDKQKERRPKLESVSGGLGGSNDGDEGGGGNKYSRERRDGNNSGEENAAAYTSNPVRDFRVVQF